MKRYQNKKKFIRNFVKYNTKGNYAIDSFGRKHFWLTVRVPKKRFNALRIKFNFKYRKWTRWKNKNEFLCTLHDHFYVLKNFCFFLYIKKTRKNIFANFSDVTGNVIYKSSSGFFHKRAFRKTFFATNYLLKIMENNIVIKKLFLEKKKQIKKRSFFFLNIVGNNYQRGFRKNLKDFLKNNLSKYRRINELKCKAHNGVRKPKKRRK